MTWAPDGLIMIFAYGFKTTWLASRGTTAEQRHMVAPRPRYVLDILMGHSTSGGWHFPPFPTSECWVSNTPDLECNPVYVNRGASQMPGGNCLHLGDTNLKPTEANPTRVSTVFSQWRCLPC